MERKNKNIKTPVQSSPFYSPWVSGLYGEQEEWDENSFEF